VVLFPGMELPLIVFEPRYRQLTQECLDSKDHFGILLLKSGHEVGDDDAQPHTIGTTAEILKVQALDNDRLRVMAIGRDRFRIKTLFHDQPYLSANVDIIPHDEYASVPDAVLSAIKKVCSTYVQSLMALRGGYLREITLPDNPEDLSYLIALFLEQRYETQQHLLQIESTTDRLIEEIKILETASGDIKEEMDRRWWSPTSRRN
jgi:Lon protease-like protein